MNVNDFDVEIPAGDMLNTILSHQRSLMDKYHAIEERNVGHFVPSSPCEHGPHCGPLDIQDRASQLQIKSFAWRITEEITEATLCLLREGTDEVHYLEEIVDALHFSVELCIMSGIEIDLPNSNGDILETLFRWSGAIPLDLNDPSCQDLLRTMSYRVIEALGDGMNRLKLKPWKTTAQLTDLEEYKKSISRFFLAFIDFAKASGFTARTMTAMYLNKNAVNQFRIRTNY